MKKQSPIIFLALLVSLISGSCNLPSAAPPVPQPPAALTEPPIPVNNIPASATATACTPTIVATTVANVRKGPGQVYEILGALPLGATANVAGKNNDATWWYIDFAAGEGGHGWIAASVTTASCIPDTLAIIAAGPAPVVIADSPTPKPKKTKTPTNVPPADGGGLIDPLPLFPIDPGIFILSDIKIDDVFLSTGGQIVVKVSVSGPATGDFEYKVWVDGSLKATLTGTLPVGSQAYWTGENVPVDIFDPGKVVKVKVDTANAYTETSEDNNAYQVTCNAISLSC